MTMNTKRIILSVIVGGFILTGAAASSAFAGGFLTDTFIRPISPAAADAADGVSREVQKRTSSESVGGQVLCGLPCFNNPPGRPAQGNSPPPRARPPLSYPAPY